MSTLQTYLSQDRRLALSRGLATPDRTVGSALFADISGFTPLTETLHEALGVRRGAEELTRHLDAVYTALIAEVESYGGSVISFAGDAITCWFDAGKIKDEEASFRAVACAFALQESMRAYASLILPNGTPTTLTLKVAVASGTARRFVVGDPAIQRIDTLAGATVARTAVAEHLANKGEVLLDEVTAQAMGELLAVQEWRVDYETNQRFAVVSQQTSVTGVKLSAHDVSSITDNQLLISSETLRPYILPALYEREQTGQETFLTEFRPCAVVFIRFTGIDYDSAEAETLLDTFTRQAQSIANRHEGALLHIIIGDKGSYAYLNFGAINAYEDDARRAVKAALELKAASSLPLQIGITQGMLRVGAYGGQTRKSFSALGDEVNIAARLMQNASTGEILLSGQMHKAVEHLFVFEPRSPLTMKGKAEPLSVFAVSGERRQRAIRLQEPEYELPMVGRQNELQIVNDKLELALQNKAQVIGIVAEAGLGKSRLVAEVIRLAHKKGFVGYGGACQSDGINTPYLAWKTIWSAFFDVDPSAPLRKQMRSLENEIEDRAPSRVAALPLLNSVLDLEIPDNDFTRTLEPQHRKSVLHTLFEECLRAAAKDEPLLIVVEDTHWIDALSHDLLEEMSKMLMDCPICFVLANRPPQITRLITPRLEALPTFTKIELHELNRDEAEQAIRAKLAQLYPARSGAIPIGLVDKLMERTQGNPFYLEELLNYLRDRGLDPRNPADLEKIELPDSLHALILSRIDQLIEREKATLRVASIIGRLFRADWLAGYYPALGELAQIKVDLEKLRALDITPLDSPEPELTYLFKHIVLHEVTYESLPFAMRAQLHEQLAYYLERQIGAGALAEASLLDTLVHHYTHSANRAKQCAYLQKAVDAALEVSAFNTAVDYLTRLVELTPATDPARAALALQLADAYYRLGDYPATRAAIAQAQVAAKTDADRAAALALLGEVTSDMGDYAEAQAILAEAVPLARSSGGGLTLCRALYALGDVNWRQGKLDDARVSLDESLALARALGDLTRELFALNRLGIVYLQIDLAKAEQLITEVHTRAVAAGNRERAMVALNNLGLVAFERKDNALARDFQQQELALAREIGAQSAIAIGLINLADADIHLGQLSTVRANLREGLRLALRLGTLPWVIGAVMSFAELAHAEGQIERALALWGLARRHPAWHIDHQRGMDLTLAEWDLDPSVVEAGLAQGAALEWNKTIEELLKE